MFNIKTIKDGHVAIGRAIAQLRRDQGISLEKLAMELHLSKTTLHKIEKGENANILTLLTLMERFGYLDTLVDFFDRLGAGSDQAPDLYGK